MNEVIVCRKLTRNDLELKPDFFQRPNESYVLGRHYVWCSLPEENRDTLPYYSRNMETNRYRACGIMRLGNGPLEESVPIHVQDIANLGDQTTPYHKVSDNPLEFAQGTETPYSDIRFYENYSTWKETDILDLKAEYWPLATFIHKETGYGAEYFCQYVTITGTYEGRSIKSLGCFDRTFIRENADIQNGIDTICNGYIFTSCSAIRKDGRKEMFYGVLGGKDLSNRAGAYWIEGEEPVVSNDVKFTAVWERTHYLPEEDPSRLYQEATWQIGNKTIHVVGKWGCSTTSGLVKNRIGTTRMSSIWFEGDNKDAYELSHSFCENMGCTQENLIKWGFKVK